jgi:4'-phosphopantetheinyl transferase
MDKEILNRQNILYGVSPIDSLIHLPDKLPLDINDIHIWQGDLDLTTSELQNLKAILSEDELGKADRFYFPQDKNLYIATRGILRSILSKYLDTSPKLIKFTYGLQGKPSIENSSRENSASYKNIGIQFNLSHSQNLALYALAIDQPVGIDLEYLRPLKDALALAKRWFTASEYGEILCHPNPELTFFRFWTAKEAYLKATGEGLRDLKAVEVTITPENSLQLKTINSSRELAQQWSLIELNPAANYVGALGISRSQEARKIFCYNLSTVSDPTLIQIKSEQLPC